jgi:hypothetical protein
MPLDERPDQSGEQAVEEQHQEALEFPMCFVA